MKQSLHDSTPNAREQLRYQALGELLSEDDATRVSLSQLLHKDIAGGLVVCTSISEMIRLEIGRGGSATNIEKLHSSLDIGLRQVLGIVRDMTESLFPPVIKVFGLHAALQQLARNTAPRFSGSLLLNITTGEPPLTMPSRLNLFRIVEAVLERCVRNHDTSWIELTTQLNGPNQLDILVDYDGDSDPWTPAEFDLSQSLIHARCLRFHVTMEVSSSQISGRTRISLSVPLEA